MDISPVALALFGTLGPAELIIILVIVLILFGVGRLPEIGAGLGKAIKSFKKATNEPDAIDVTPKKEDSEKAPEAEPKHVK